MQTLLMSEQRHGMRTIGREGQVKVATLTIIMMLF